MTKNTQNIPHLTAKEILSRQWYLTKLCFRTAPGYMTLHVIESVKLQISIFFEFIWCINYILEVAENGGSYKKILWCMGILLAAIALSTFSAACYHHHTKPKMMPMLYQAFRLEIYGRARTLDLANYDDTEYYQKFVLATEESDKCIDRYLAALDSFSGCITSFLLALIFTLTINPIIIIIPLLALPFSLWTVHNENKAIVTARLQRIAHEQKREYQNRIFYLGDYARELRMNPEMQEKCKADFHDSNEEILKINRHYGKRALFYGFLNNGMCNVMPQNGIILSILLYQVIVLQTLPLAHMVTTYTSSRYIHSALFNLVHTWRDIAENSAYLAQIYSLLSQESQICSEKNTAVPKKPQQLSIKHVNFSYVPGKPILHDVNLSIQPGQKIALVGYNGSGKTTLVKLLLRLYDPDNGRICYGEHDIRDYQPEEYRHSIGSVFQDFKIYAATLKENVLLDISTESKEERFAVENALHGAHFTLNDKRLIYQVETSLTTEFEKDGVNLSGGESQKVAIARTLYRNQNLLIMDEPSSALDPLAEYKLNQELNEIAKDKTVIFISHRLSTTRDADCIYMMEHGRIVESGTHKELLSLNGKYAAMWKVQSSLYQNV